MASRFLDISAPVARALNTNALIVAIETGFFMRLPYPKNRDALAECEQAFSRRSCVPCCIGVVDGRLKAGLNKEDMDRLCQAGGSCARGDLPSLAASGGTSGTGAGATMAVARMAGIEPVMAPVTARPMLPALPVTEEPEPQIVVHSPPLPPLPHSRQYSCCWSSALLLPSARPLDMPSTLTT